MAKKGFLFASTTIMPTSLLAVDSLVFSLSLYSKISIENKQNSNMWARQKFKKWHIFSMQPNFLALALPKDGQI